MSVRLVRLKVGIQEIHKIKEVQKRTKFTCLDIEIQCSYEKYIPKVKIHEIYIQTSNV